MRDSMHKKLRPTPLPRLTVPRTYMSAYGVQSEIATKTLAKVAREEALYRVEVKRYRHDLEGKVKSIKREQQLLRNSIKGYEEKLNQVPVLDEHGKVKPSVMRRYHKRSSFEDARKAHLKQRTEMLGIKHGVLLSNFYEQIDEKIVKDKADCNRKLLDQLAEKEKSEHPQRRRRRSRAFFQPLIVDETSPSFNDYDFIFDFDSDSETDPEEDEDKDKKDGGVPKVCIDRGDLRDFLYVQKSFNSSKDVEDLESLSTLAKAKNTPVSQEQKKQEHDIKVQKVSQRYVQFLARNAEANREKAAAEKQCADKGQDIINLSLLHQPSMVLPDIKVGSPYHHHTDNDGKRIIKGTKNENHHESTRGGVSQLRTQQRRVVSKKSSESSFMQLVRLQQSTGISSNLKLIDELLHRKIKDKNAHLAGLIEKAAERRHMVPAETRNAQQKMPEGAQKRETVYTPNTRLPKIVKDDYLEFQRNDDGKEDRKYSNAAKKSKEKIKRDIDAIYDRAKASSVHYASFGFPQRLPLSRKLNSNYFAVVDTESEYSFTSPLPKTVIVKRNPKKVVIASNCEHGEKNDLPRDIAAEENGKGKIQIKREPTRDDNKKTSDRALQPVWVTSLMVTGQGLLYPGTVLDEYIDKKLKMERKDSASLRQSLIWREALAQIRKVHYLSDQD